MIHISLSPNLEIDDVWLSLKWLITPLPYWLKKKNQEKLEKKLYSLFPKAKAIFLLNSGRSALMLGLKALNLPKNSNVLLQAFTCSAVPNSILWNKLTPKYIDINKKDYNLNIENLPSNPEAKALIVQHTFGQPVELDKVVEYCQKNKLYLIEDCAHSLGSKYKNEITGSFGDIAILSFGRDKVISSVFGGALIINDKNLVKPAKSLYQNLSYPSLFWTIQQLFHPPITYFSRITYPFYLGKLILVTAQKIKLISKAIYPEECNHQVPVVFPARLPEPLANLTDHQIKKLNRFNLHRQQIASYYDKNISHPSIFKPVFNPDGTYLRYTILVDQPEKLKLYLRKYGFIIEKNHWYIKPITPSNNLSEIGYQEGQCPVAEEVCRKCLNLPTHPLLTFENAKKIVNILNQW